MSVLDIGCGTGAITAGIARLVGSKGCVVGIDRDTVLLETARQEHAAVSNLRFDVADGLSLPLEVQFDVVTAARTLQWISAPEAALEQMKRATKPGGIVVVLDYNHERNWWEPEPPLEFRQFYKAFLDWRTTNNWDNRIADRLPDLFRSVGMADIQESVQDEMVTRDDADFASGASIWTHVIEGLGPAIVDAGFLDERARLHTETIYRSWVATDLRIQRLSMQAVNGRAPG